jgi:hypothetical protein
VRLTPAVAAVLGLLAVTPPAHARISAEDRAAVEAFKAAVRGEREFAPDFMVHPPTEEERAFLVNLGQCDASGLDERRGSL